MNNSLINYLFFLTKNQREQVVQFAKDYIKEGKNKDERYYVLFHPDISNSSEDSIVGLIQSNDISSSYLLKDLASIDLSIFNHKPVSSTSRTSKDKLLKERQKELSKKISSMSILACKKIRKAISNEEASKIRNQLNTDIVDLRKHYTTA